MKDFFAKNYKLLVPVLIIAVAVLGYKLYKMKKDNESLKEKVQLIDSAAAAGAKSFAGKIGDADQLSLKN